MADRAPTTVPTAGPAAAPAAEPEAIYFNAKIVTLDAAGSTAGAVAVQDGKVLKVGSADEIKKLAGSSTRLIDLGGKTVVPGFIDAHCHPMEAMLMKETWVDCRYPQTPSVKQALINIADWAKKTQRAYLGCVRHFVRHYMRSPQEMGEQEGRDFLLHLVRDRNASPATQDM